MVSKFNNDDKSRLIDDKGIIRNKLKINAVINNALVIVSIQKKHGSFKNWLDLNHPKEKKEWVKLFKKVFKFTGREITNEFLMSTGYLEGAHEEFCPIYKKLNTKKMDTRRV